MGKYLFNKETQKIELHFDKSEYLALSEQEKQEIKSKFLWSNTNKAWVSRSIHYHYHAEQIAKKLNLENAGEVGQRLSYAEELDKKSERAEARAERYEEYSGNAEQRAKQLQSALEKYRGDIAFFTQPIIAGHAGSRAFNNYREKLFNRYFRGFDEYKKSEYFQERAATARATAEQSKLKDKIYLHNRIKECKANIKKLQESITKIEDNIYKLQQGETLKAWDGTQLTESGQEKCLENYFEKYDYEQGKLEFFEENLENLGGVAFSQENIKVGYIVNIQRWGNVEVTGTGSVNFTYKHDVGNMKDWPGQSPYAAIIKIVSDKKKENKLINPYVVGDILCKHRMGDQSIYKAFQVIKATAASVTLQEIEVKNGIPVQGNFISGKSSFLRKITQSKFSDFVGVYDDDWQLHKYQAG